MLPSKTLYPYQATALLTAVGPVVPAAVELVPSLVEALAGDTGVALWAAEEIGAGVLAVAGCPPAENPPILRGHSALTSTTNRQPAARIRSRGRVPSVGTDSKRHVMQYRLLNVFDVTANKDWILPVVRNTSNTSIVPVPISACIRYGLSLTVLFPCLQLIECKRKQHLRRNIVKRFHISLVTSMNSSSRYHSIHVIFV